MSELTKLLIIFIIITKFVDPIEKKHKIITTIMTLFLYKFEFIFICSHFFCVIVSLIFSVFLNV